MMFLWLPLLLVVPFALIWSLRHGYARGCGRLGHGVYGPYAATRETEPIEIARLRLARGEITASEYETIRRTLG